MAENFAQGLLGNPLINFGAGLLSVAGPSRQPRSLGEGLLIGLNQAQRAQSSALRNRLIRERMEQEARQKEAVGLLARQLAPRTAVDPENAPQGIAGAEALTTQPDPETANMMGLLAQAAPEQFAQGLIQQQFGQQRAAPSDIRSMQALGLPLTPEGFKQFQELKGDSGMEGLKASQMQIQQQLDLLRLQREVREGRTEEADQTRKKIAARQDVNNAVGRLEELVTLNERLKDTIGESGIGFAEARGLGAGLFPALTRAFGGDEAKARQTAADFQRFEQLTTSEALNAMASADGLGQGTNAKLATILQTKPGTNRLPSVNNKIFADMLQTVLDDAERQDIELPNRDELKDRIKQLRGGEGQTRRPASERSRAKTPRDMSDAELRRRLGIK